MCGIAGHVGRRRLDDARLGECLAGMRRRGPDHAAARRFSVGERLVDLLYSRLSIIDLDPRANQPVHVGTRWMVYNGELYNYVELQKELEAAGVELLTHSDSEVLLRSIDHFGWEVLDRCEGMWAFAVYDEADGSLTLCRDRFGEKPLYVYREGDDLYFGSEVKCIASLRGGRLVVDEEHLQRYLVNGYKALYKGPHAFFRGLTELAPGSCLRIDAAGREERRRYWHPVPQPDEGMTYEDAVAGARERLVRSVEIRLRADVPLAFCMSGGVDSNALISVAKNVFGYDVHGFTIVNSDARYEESEMVAHAVAALDIRHTEVPLVTDGFLSRLRTLVRYHDAPVYTITYFTHWLLMEQIAARGYRIAVSGTAADELFTGYYDHHLAYLHEMRHDAAGHAAARAAWEQHIRPLVRNPYLRDPDVFVKDPDFRNHIFLDAAEFADYLRRPWLEPFHEERFTEGLLRNRMLNELFREAVPVILHEDDLNAMYYSIENRSPFLDRGLFDFCARIPTRHLIQHGRAKAVLREAMRGIAPAPVMENRRKVGFNAPIESLLDTRDPGVRRILLQDSPIFDLVRREAIENLLDRGGLPNSQSKFLFSFVSSKMFVEEFGG